MEEEKELALLEEELIQLSVKSPLVKPSEKPALLCTVWTKKTYNADNLRVKLRSIWKKRKKFEILLVGQNLFSISFKDEEYLEQIMEGRPWLFRKQVVILDRITKLMEWSKIKLVSSSFWIKIGPCPPKYDKKDLMHGWDPRLGV
ncbi:hypothetical protein J1N35_022314 [Gossypium stocksii]|uniref:DUF4283 domain-containing protein n=1 Tax=Gossypium stocksii TaxID=47602 RepID=A0A9D4A255_9ROSI|nr:hypothetical protein J1N35_022314 [Gossypium stocksii]